MIPYKVNKRWFKPLAPPEQYAVVDHGLCRAMLPFTRHNLKFLSAQNIGCFFNLSTAPLHETILGFAQESGIIVVNTSRSGSSRVGDRGSGGDEGDVGVEVGGRGKNHRNGRENGFKAESNDGFVTEQFKKQVKVAASLASLSDVSVAATWIVETVTKLLSLGEHGKILLITDRPICVDAIILACVRRLQHWSMSAVLSELRFIAGPHLYDIEQLVESVDLSVLEAQRGEWAISAATPTFMSWDDGDILAMAAASEEMTSSNEREELLGKLFGRTHCVLTCDEIKFDPVTCLIHEKDDEID